MTEETLTKLRKAFNTNRDRKNKLVEKTKKYPRYINRVLAGDFYNSDVIQAALEILEEEAEGLEKLNNTLDKIA
jgi:hypothetical protein